MSMFCQCRLSTDSRHPNTSPVWSTAAMNASITASHLAGQAGETPAQREQRIAAVIRGADVQPGSANSRRASASATSMPSTPADMMPPA